MEVFQLPTGLRSTTGTLISIGTIIRYLQKAISNGEIKFGFISSQEIEEIKNFLRENEIEVNEINIRMICFIRDMELIPMAGSIYRDLQKKSLSIKDSKDIDRTKDINTLSDELCLPPSLICKLIKCKANYPELSDLNSPGSMRIISQKAADYERRVHEKLNEMKIPHKTEHELKMEKKQLTPDFYFETPLILSFNDGEEKKIRWMDVKNYTFYGNTFFVKKLLEQSKKYNEAFCGDGEIGAMVFSGDVLLLNITKPTPAILELSSITLLLNGSSI